MACGLHMLELEFSFYDEKIVSKQTLDWVKVKIELRYEIWVLNFELQQLSDRNWVRVIC